MKIIPRDKVKNYSLPLPLYESLHIADAIARDGSEFDLLVGLDRQGAEKLRERALDDSDNALQDFTGDRQRFVESTYESWYEKNRTIFALVHKQSDDLAAVIWFGPKPLGKKSPKFGQDDGQKEDSEWHTISFRSYPQYRGKGMMKNFSEYVTDIYKRYFPRAKLWTGTDDRNTAFIRLITSLGFSVDEESSDLVAHWLILKKI